MCYSSDFTIICLTETWLADHVSDGEILPNGFVLYRKDRTKCGGGVFIAVKSCVPSSLVPSPPDLEVISVEVGTKHDLFYALSISHQIHLMSYFLTSFVSKWLSFLI